MVCPVCTVAVGAGVGFLRAWGINDIITGIWFGALIVSSIAWMIDYLNRKNIHFLFRKILVIIAFYALFIVPLYYWKINGEPVMGALGNVIFGIDKVLFGVIIGTIVFILAMLANNYLKKINDNRVMINYQKILIPLIFLIIVSVIANLLIKISSI
ncbi:hypothetical protein FJZ17_03535 [Candidatus Pacearchaeota archaeon]|nr:hypothetical protein [Candidatus Pacearchaeota archaeon]